MSDINWRDIQNESPKTGDFILYAIDKCITMNVGRYCSIENPMPSIPDWMRWDLVKYWALIDRTLDKV